MKIKFFIFSLLIVCFGCQNNNPRFILISIGFSENPNTPRRALFINEMNECFFCVETNKRGEYIYYKSRISNSDWKYFQEYIDKNHLTDNKINYNELLDAPVVELIFNNDKEYFRVENLSQIDNFDFAFLKQIDEIIKSPNAKKIKYFPFISSILNEELPAPPPIN